jgi:hypothetical protein
MASSIDDLRYISRYGYQDPWAEATKSITSSLLAYGKSKLQRDLLIAQFEDKQQDREDRKIRERIAGNRHTYSMFTNPEDKKEFTKDPQVAQDVFGPQGMTPGVENLDRQISVSNELESYEDVYKNPASTFSQSKNALIDARILATTNKLTGKSSGYGYELQRLQNKFIQDSNEEFLVKFAQSGSGKWITKEVADQAIKDIELGKISQVQTTLNRAFSQKGTDLSYIESSYKNYLSKYDNAFKDTDGMWIDELSAEQYKSLRTSLDSRFMSLLPIKYQDKTKPVQQNIEEARLRLDPETGLPPKDPKDPKDPLKDPKTVTVLKPNRVLNIVSPDEVKDYSSLQNVKVLNKFTGQEQVMSGTQATQMGPNNVEILHDSKDNKNAYIELSSEYHDGLEAYVAAVKNPKDGSSMLVQKGMTVIDKSSGKRFKVSGIKEIEDIKRAGTYYGVGSPSALKSVARYHYIVNGKKYTGPNFRSKFGVPFYEEVEVDSTVSRPTVTGFSVKPVK